MVREPAVAGQFYPGTKEDLNRTIRDCFVHDLGPGETPKEKGSKRKIKGMVSPHAGYMYSGPVAAHGFKALYEDGIPDTFIIIGPNHHGFGPAVSITDQDFKTPLGVARVNKELVAELENDLVMKDDRSHTNEHSLEVQIPFIQYISDDAEIVPICMLKQDISTARSLGNHIKDVTKNRDVVVVASTDFSHYVLKETAEKKDMFALDKIMANDPDGLYRIIEKEHISMCGYGPVAAMICGTGFDSAELLKYATSGDVTAMRDVVGYASMIFR